MLTCLPRFFGSWSYDVSGEGSGTARVTFNFFTEQGTIAFQGSEYRVRKHGPLSGRWTLERDGKVCAEARKPSAFFRSFEVRSGAAEFTVKARSAFTRGYDLLARGTVVGTIRPAHAFTRRAVIECRSSVPELSQLFSFWLVVLTWRRAADNSSATNGSG